MKFFIGKSVSPAGEMSVEDRQVRIKAETESDARAAYQKAFPSGRFDLRGEEETDDTETPVGSVRDYNQ